MKFTKKFANASLLMLTNKAVSPSKTLSSVSSMDNSSKLGDVLMYYKISLFEKKHYLLLKLFKFILNLNVILKL